MRKIKLEFLKKDLNLSPELTFGKNSPDTSNVVNNKLGLSSLFSLYKMGKRLLNKISNMSKIPHPKGRKMAQLTKKTIRAAGRDKVKSHHQMKVNIIGEKIMWFKENLDPVDNYTPQLTINLIERYLGRFDEELEQIRLKQSTGKRKGRQHASREDIINMTIKNEKNEFSTCGIEMPDVLNPQQLNLLRNWSGELKYLQHFKLVRYTKSKLENMKCPVKNPEEERKKAIGVESGKKEEGSKTKEELMDVS